ncbi:MAG TPA: type II secretion system protein, partial [Luteolibacter sp.]
MICPARPLKRGFLLLEMILALAVFGIAATGFAVALHRMADAASLAQSELRITRILESALNETLSLPTLEEGTTNSSVGKTGIELDTTISLLE